MRSAADFAGVSLRCREGKLEMAVIVIQPLPLHAQPRVTITDAAGTVEVQASVGSPGSAIVLSPETTAAILPRWRVGDATLGVHSGVTDVTGTVTLAGFTAALDRLRLTCTSDQERPPAPSLDMRPPR